MTLFEFALSLHGGELAFVKVPVPLTRQNLERLQRMIGDQLEPLVDDNPTPAPREEE